LSLFPSVDQTASTNFSLLLCAFRWLLAVGVGNDAGRLARALLLAVATHTVGDRPGRVEPREVKRRQKVRRLSQPRAQRRAELLPGVGLGTVKRRRGEGSPSQLVEAGPTVPAAMRAG
jgi:hypothetical protein